MFMTAAAAIEAKFSDEKGPPASFAEDYGEPDCHY
jgi:hypothetical protein